MKIPAPFRGEYGFLLPVGWCHTGFTVLSVIRLKDIEGRTRLAAFFQAGRPARRGSAGLDTFRPASTNVTLPPVAIRYVLFIVVWCPRLSPVSSLRSSARRRRSFGEHEDKRGKCLSPALAALPKRVVRRTALQVDSGAAFHDPASGNILRHW